MKASKKSLLRVAVVIAFIAIMVYCVGFTNSRETPTSAVTPTPIATPTPTPIATPTDEPGSLYYEETVRFNEVDLIKKDIPKWLVDAISTDDPVVVARTIAKKNPADFKIRRIFNKDSTGFYCLWEGYIRKEGDEISVANGDIEINLEEPTVNLAIPDADELSFEFVEALIKLLWERDQKNFWTERYEHYIEVKKIPFPTEKELAICVDGEFLSLMPTATSAPEITDASVKYASDYSERSEIWVDDSGTFYCIESSTFMLLKWTWNPSKYVDEYWERTGDIPTIQDFVISDKQSEGYWYLTEDGSTVTIFEPWEAPETTGEFGIKPILSIKFDEVNIVRPFVDYEGPEAFTQAYVAIPETNTIWKITSCVIATCQLSQIEILDNEIYVKDGGKVERIASKKSDIWLGSWSGRYIETCKKLEFSNVLEFEDDLQKISLAPNVKMESREGKIVFVTEGATVTIE